MSGMRKWLCLLFGVAFAAFAAPSFAAKLFGFSIDGSANLDWSNSPQNSGGQSVINSVKLSVPANAPLNSGGYVFTITGWTGTGGTLYNSPTTPTAQTPPVSVPYNVPAGATLWIKGIVGSGPGQVFQVFTSNMTGGCSGSATLTAAAWTGNTWGGTQFTPASAGADQAPIPCFGNLVCAVLQSDINPTLDGNQHSKVGRGEFDSDGTDCGNLAVPYSSVFINNPGTKQTFVLNEVSGNQHPTGEYVISWAAAPLDPSVPTVMPTFQPQVAWLNIDGTPANQPGTPAYINAQPCAGDDLTSSNSTKKIMPIMPVTGAPYNADGTTTKAKACIAEQGWALVEVPVGSGNWAIQFWDRVLDQSDLRLTGP